MKKRLLLLIMLWTAIGAKAQTNTDSLMNLLKTAKEDTTKVQLYINIGFLIESENPKAAGSYYLLAKNLSEQLNYKQGIIKSIFNYTDVLNQRSDYDSSLLLNKQSIALAEQLQDNILLGKTHNNTGISFEYLGIYDSAVYHIETGKKYFEQADDKYLIARACDALQNVYTDLNQYQKALALSKEAVEVLRKINDSLYLGKAIANLAKNYMLLKTLDTAEKYFNEVLAISQKIDYPSLELDCMLNMGNIYLFKYDANKMKPYYERALVLSKELEYPESEEMAYKGIALYFLFSKNYIEANNNISKALYLTDSLKMAVEHVGNLKILASILFAQQDIIGGEKYLDSASNMENQILINQITERALVIEKRFETQKKETQIQLQQAQLQQKSTLNYLLMTGAAALLLILLLGYRNYKRRQKLQQAKINQLETEKQLSAAQSLMQGQEDERNRLAKDLHDGLGGLLSGVKLQLGAMKGNLILTEETGALFNRALNKLDESISEMRRVAHNMMPEALIKLGLKQALEDFCEGIGASRLLKINTEFYGLEQRLNASTEVIVYRIVQELVNNVIKHAAASEMLVQVMHQGDMLTITVEDNGKGFDAALWETSNSAGLQNIRSRVNYLRGKINIQSQPGKGASVYIECKVE
jgi:signal transduction histidine kinase